MSYVVSIVSCHGIELQRKANLSGHSPILDSSLSISDKYKVIDIKISSNGTTWGYIIVVQRKDNELQCSKGREQNFQFWKLLAVVLDTNIKSVNKVHKRSDETLVMLPLI